jgi:hypothetical protein
MDSTHHIIHKGNFIIDLKHNAWEGEGSYAYTLRRKGMCKVKTLVCGLQQNKGLVGSGQTISMHLNEVH